MIDFMIGQGAGWFSIKYTFSKRHHCLNATDINSNSTGTCITLQEVNTSL